MVDPSPPRCVKALFTFKGTHNDELCFNKGDIIKVTQTLDGGWWEGTLHGKTGWFPSNYVREIKTDSVVGVLPGFAATRQNNDNSIMKRESMMYYHYVVLQNVIETEKQHVEEIHTILQTYIRPLRALTALTPNEYARLIGNLEEVAGVCQAFLSALEECTKLPHQQRRVGGVFMMFAPRFKELFEDYCSNHPRAVSILQKYRDALNKAMESLGAPLPGTMLLTTSLSAPFTRLGRYPSLLKELERHIEDIHVDRGDTQRAITIYTELACACAEIRKLKEMENEIINSAIEGWEGEAISKLGDIVRICKAKLHSDSEKLDRILVLFPSVLVMLSVSPRLSGYHYEGRLLLSGMSVSPCDEAEHGPNSFQILVEQGLRIFPHCEQLNKVDKVSMLEQLIFTCPTTRDFLEWLDAIQHQIDTSSIKLPSRSQSLQVTSSHPTVSQMAPAKSAKISPIPLPPQVPNFAQAHYPPQPFPHAGRTLTSPRPMSPLSPLSPQHSKKPYKPWLMSCLRPHPPLRPSLATDQSRKNGNISRHKKDGEEEYDYIWRRYDPRTFDEDAVVLSVIEAYCNSAKSRHTVGSFIFDEMKIIFPEEEKIIVESDTADGPGLEEKTLVDTVYSLKDQIKNILMEQKRLRKDMDGERKARKKLEDIVKALKNNNLTSLEQAIT